MYYSAVWKTHYSTIEIKENRESKAKINSKITLSQDQII